MLLCTRIMENIKKSISEAKKIDHVYILKLTKKL